MPYHSPVRLQDLLKKQVREQVRIENAGLARFTPQLKADVRKMERVLALGGGMAGFERQLEAHIDKQRREVLRIASRGVVAGVRFFDFSLRDIAVSTKQDLASARFLSRTRSAIRGEVTSIYSGTSGVERARAYKSVREGVEAGLSQKAIARKVAADTEQSLTRGLRRNVRTLVHRSYNSAQLDAAKDYEGSRNLWKVWVAANDSRTRPTHAEANGQKVKAPDEFSVGGYAMNMPGDFTAPPSESAQCRCAVIWEDGDDEGDFEAEPVIGEDESNPNAPTFSNLKRLNPYRGGNSPYLAQNAKGEAILDNTLHNGALKSAKLQKYHSKLPNYFVDDAFTEGVPASTRPKRTFANRKNPKTLLQTQDEWGEAVGTYISDSEGVNLAARSFSPGGEGELAKSTVDDLLAMFQDDRTALARPVVSYRGTSVSEYVYQRNYAGIKPSAKGATSVIDEGFMSVSTSSKVPETFLGKGADKPRLLIMQVNLPKGARVVTTNAAEMEHILPAGSKFRIKRVIDKPRLAKGVEVDFFATPAEARKVARRGYTRVDESGRLIMHRADKFLELELVPSKPPKDFAEHYANRIKRLFKRKRGSKAEVLTEKPSRATIDASMTKETGTGYRFPIPKPDDARRRARWEDAPEFLPEEERLTAEQRRVLAEMNEELDLRRKVQSGVLPLPRV